MTAHVRVARVVAAPADLVWAVLTDWERQGDWIPATRVRAMNADAVGGRIEAWTGLGPVGFLDTMEITLWDPPRRCEVLHTGRLVNGPGAFDVQPLGPAGCRVVWEEHVDLPFGVAGRVGWQVVRPFARAGLAAALRRLDSVVVSWPDGRSSRRGGRRRRPRPAWSRRQWSGRRRRNHCV